ncbi:GPW/gp25 family protein [Ursidibacter sp. B-7004-1]
MDKKTGLTLLDENAHIRQSVADILLTPIGSRVMRREYGSQLFELIDRPLNMALALQIAAASVMALKRWEPRIEITRFKIHYDPNYPSQVTADLDGINKNNQTKLAFADLALR